MTEDKIKSGAHQDIFDSRDYKWSNIGKDSSPFDWNLGYDIESLLGLKLSPKDQNGSYSCGGQAFSYYGAAKEAFMTKTYEERSAKFIYSQTYAVGGGTRGRDLCELVKNSGFGSEVFTPSYENGKPPSEEFMTKSQDITDVARQFAKGTTALSYVSINSTDIDSIAQAIRDNQGCVIGVAGQNGKGWLGEFPESPEQSDWRHWLYAGKAKMINGKKYIGVINSWGNVGNNGWQWISEDYFKTKIGDTDAVWSAWTLVLNKVDQTTERNNILRTLIMALIKFFKK